MDEKKEVLKNCLLRFKNWQTTKGGNGGKRGKQRADRKRVRWHITSTSQGGGDGKYRWDGQKIKGKKIGGQKKTIKQ